MTVGRRKQLLSGKHNYSPVFISGWLPQAGKPVNIREVRRACRSLFLNEMAGLFILLALYEIH